MTENPTPYREIAGELLADVVLLFKQLLARRPEVATLPGTLHVAFDSAAGVILIALLQPDGRAVLVERILADPAHGDHFGASELPTVTAADAPGVTH